MPHQPAHPRSIVFFGSGAFGLPTLQQLAQHHRILAVVTQPDRPAGRGGALTPTPIGTWAAAHLPGVPVLKPARVNDAAVVAQTRALGVDAWVVIAFGQKLSAALLADRFAINLHASLLPRWRGAAPINAAILAGDRETGNSVITLADRMDAGFVLGQSRRPIDPRVTAGELHDQLAADGPALVEDVLAKHAAGALNPLTQDESLVTIAPKLSKADGVIDFANAEACQRRVHAFNPWPGVTASLDTGTGATVELKLLRASAATLVAPHGKPAGALIATGPGLAACANGSALQLIEVQPAGKRPMPWADFARGRSLSDAARFLVRAPGGAV